MAFISFFGFVLGEYFWMSSSSASLKSIALESGYSLSTVSRALDPSRCHLVRLPTREKIQACAARHRFSINSSARRLKLNCTETITAVAFRHDLRRQLFSHEFVSLTVSQDDLEGVVSAARERHYDTKVEYISPDQDLSVLASELLDKNRTDGVIFISYYGLAFQPRLEELRLPHMYMSRYMDLARQDVPYVGLERRTGYEEALERMLAEGRERIGWLGIPVARGTPRNRKILAELLQERGLYREELFHDISDYYMLRQVLSMYSPGRYDAIFCSNDVMADWVVRELRHLGVTVPDALRVIGYDNDPGFHTDDQRGISSIGLPRQAMCWCAVDLVIDMIEDYDAIRPSREVFYSQFFLRET